MSRQKQVKKFLQGYQRATLELEGLQEEHERLISVAYSITANQEGVGGGTGPSDKVGNAVAALVDLCNDIDDGIKRYIQVRDDVHSIVRQVMHHNLVWGQCLHYRYIMGHRPPDVAHAMGYDPRWERRIHCAAVEYVADLIGLSDDSEASSDAATEEEYLREALASCETRPQKPSFSVI